MTIPIQWMPAEYNQRRPSTSALIGEGLGRGIGKSLEESSGLYLKNKIQNYFEKQKQEESAQGYEKLTGIKGLAQKLSGIPREYHGAAVQEFGGGPSLIDEIYGTGRGGGAAARTAPAISQPAPQTNIPMAQGPQSIPQSLDIAQRLGLPTAAGLSPFNIAGGQGAQTAPGQSAYGQLEEGSPAREREPVTPEGTVPPRPVTNYPLANKSDEEIEAMAARHPGETNRMALYKARETERASQRAEETLQEKKAKGAREAEKWQTEKEKPARDYMKSLSDEYESSLKTKNLYKSLEKKAPDLQNHHVFWKYIQKKFNLPAGATFDTTGQYMDKIAEQLMRGIGGTYKGKILATEFDSWRSSNASLMNTKEGIIKLAQLALAQDKLVEKKWNEARRIEVQAKKAKQPIPEDLQQRVLEKTAGFSDEVFDDMSKIMGIEPEHLGEIWMRSPDGRVGWVKKDSLQEALALEFTIE